MKELASCFPDSHGINEIASMALAELYSHKEITTCLSTMQNTRELKENLIAFEKGRLFGSQYVPQRDIKRYCTKCRYCKGCPVGIPISDIMYAYNNLTFSDLTVGYGKYDLRSSAQLFNPRFCDYNAIPETKDNPCIRCGQCEKKCTQKLPIIQSIKNFYDTAAKGSYTREQ